MALLMASDTLLTLRHRRFRPSPRYTTITCDLSVLDQDRETGGTDAFLGFGAYISYRASALPPLKCSMV